MESLKHYNDGSLINYEIPVLIAAYAVIAFLVLMKML